MRFKGYKFSFRINASHKTNENASSPHNHTFEIALYIEPHENFQAFYEMENLVTDQINQYNGKCLNDVSPFDTINPTVENMGQALFNEIFAKVSVKGYRLFQLDISETPNRIFSVCDFELSERKKKAFQNAIRMRHTIKSAENIQLKTDNKDNLHKLEITDNAKTKFHEPALANSAASQKFGILSAWT